LWLGKNGFETGQKKTAEIHNKSVDCPAIGDDAAEPKLTVPQDERTTEKKYEGAIRDESRYDPDFR
jgi:hypothetical protein